MTPEAIKQLAADLAAAYRDCKTVPAPTVRDPQFDLAAAYAVEAELVRMREATGRTAVGLKVGYANKAMWRALKLETLVWGHMYDDTVVFAEDNHAELSLQEMLAPKIEPEIVFKLNRPFSGSADPKTALESVEWLALGFEIIDCVFPDWQFQPADFVAAYGLHRRLIVGSPLRVHPETIEQLSNQLPQFKLRLIRNEGLVEEGSGRNSLRSPALCLGELARVAPLNAGDLVSSGTLTTSTLMAFGDSWRAEVDGLDLPPLRLFL
jgi:2-keto-4-pentenoate hydratase